MPRKLRQVEPGAVYHFIARFVANEWLIPTDVERRQYLHLLGRGLRGSDWKCISYGIMSSHVHLGILAGQQPMTRWLRGAHGIFADWINIRRARIGAVFVRGPKLLKVKTFGVNDLVAYIHNNPVRAGVVASPDATDWTSYRAYSRGIRLPWLDVETGVRLARMPDAQSVAAHALVSRASRADFEIPRRNARGLGEHGEHDEYDEFDEYDEYLGDEDEGEDEDDAGAASTVDPSAPLRDSDAVGAADGRRDRTAESAGSDPFCPAGCPAGGQPRDARASKRPASARPRPETAAATRARSSVRFSDESGLQN